MSDELKQAVLRHMAGQGQAGHGVVMPLPGLFLVQRNSPSELEHTVERPLVCLVLQGRKRVAMGRGVSTYSAGDMMVVTGNVPTATRISQASVANPYLALALDLDPAVITDLMASAPEGRPPRASKESAAAAAQPSAGDSPGIDTQDIDSDLRDALRRLVLLLNRPHSLAVLKDALIREIHHWLLWGAQGPAIRNLGLPGSHAHRIARAVATLRADYASPLPIEQLAAAAGMSRSTFHQHFRAVTTLSPLQFQKHLRLIEARRLILSSGKALSQAAFEVGYESASQFSREYTRLYGRSPTKDKEAAEGGWIAPGAGAEPGDGDGDGVSTWKARLRARNRAR